MKRIKELSERQISKLLDAGEFILHFGPFQVAVRSDVPQLASVLRVVYGPYPVVEASAAEFLDMRVSLLRVRGLRATLRPQIRIFLDGIFPFEPFPLGVHLPFLEWGMNWGIAQRGNMHFLLHAGVVEKKGCGIVLSALPASGKSTLTAALVASGYRHFSDEFGVVRLSDKRLLPLLRPIALKNESIALIKSFNSGMVFGPTFRNTRKGDVAHMVPTEESIARRNEPVTPQLILFPKFVPGSAALLEPVPPSRAFSRLSVNSFNYELLGPASFQALAEIAGRCPAYSLRFSDLGGAISAIERLMT